MPSVSKAQQRFMGMVHALQKGEIKPSKVSGKVKKAAKSMKKKDADDFASTKHKGLPNKVKKEELYRLIAKYGAKKVRESIFAVKGKEDHQGYRHAEKPNFKYDEGFGGQLKGSDRKKFEKARKENAEVLGYKLTGTKDIKESSSAYGKSIEKIANDRKLKSLSKKDRDTLMKIAKLMKKSNESVNEAKSFKPEKRRKLKSGEVEVMKGRGSKQKWFYLKDKNDVHKLIRLGRNYGFPTGITNNNSRIDKSFIKRLSINERLIDIDKQMKDGTFDEKNPQVHIMGYGVMSLKNLGEQLSKKFTDLAKRAKKGEIENVDSVLNKSGVLQGFVKAYMDAKKELKSSSMKRKITMYKRSR